MNKEYFRRRLVVRPRLQFGLLLLMAASCMLGCFITHFFYSLQNPATESTFLVSAEAATWIAFGAGMALFLPLMYYTLLLSNRLAGPIYRLIRHMNAVAKGERPGSLTFRSRDFHPDLAAAYNRLLERIERR